MFDSERTQIRDAGRGATIRLYQLKLPIWRIDVQFLTHYHSDHTTGIPDLWLTGWLESHYGRCRKPFRVIGPLGAKKLMSHLEQAYALDTKIRMEDEKLKNSPRRELRSRSRNLPSTAPFTKAMGCESSHSRSTTAMPSSPRTGTESNMTRVSSLSRVIPH